MLSLSNPAFWFFQFDLWSRLLAEFSHDRTLWLAFLVILVGGLLLHRAPHEKKHIRAALLLFGLYFFSLPLLALLRAFSFTMAADYLRLMATILLISSLINMGSLFMYDVLLPVARLPVPRILRDTT